MTAENSADMKEIRILHDTGACQSLQAEGVLKQSVPGKTVLIYGVELALSSVPHYRVFLNSDLVSGPIIVGVRLTLPELAPR